MRTCRAKRDWGTPRHRPGTEESEAPASNAALEVQQAAEFVAPETPGPRPERGVRPYSGDLIDIGIAPQEGGVALLGQHDDAGFRVPAAQGPEERSREENLGDRTEPNNEDLRRHDDDGVHYKPRSGR
jgi:hypothetical protein